MRREVLRGISAISAAVFDGAFFMTAISGVEFLIWLLIAASTTSSLGDWLADLDSVAVRGDHLRH